MDRDEGDAIGRFGERGTAEGKRVARVSNDRPPHFAISMAISTAILSSASFRPFLRELWWWLGDLNTSGRI
jgi:hypothetical protein